MADITQLRFAQGLKRAFGLKTVDPGRRLAPQVSPVYSLSDVYSPESRLDRGERNFVLGQEFTNTAAVNFGCMNITNPVGSGKLVILKRALWTFNLPTTANQPGQVFTYLQNPVPNAVGPGGINGRFKDGRIGGAAVFPTVTGQGITAGVMGPAVGVNNAVSFVRWFGGATTQAVLFIDDQLDVVMQPGTTVQMAVLSDTLPVASWNWDGLVEGYERIADPSELLTAPP